MVENNPHFISKNMTGTLTPIEDSVDFMHTGLIKALQQMAKGNIVVRNNSNDFDITQAGSGNVIQVSAGTYLRDGLKYTASAANFTTSAFTTSYDKGYHLLVVNSSNALAIRQPTVIDKVAVYTAGDTLIAMIEYSSTTSWGSRRIQYLTTGKVANSVSVAYDNSSVYTEAMSIYGNVDRTVFKNNIANADIRFILADNTADEKFEILSDDDSDGDEGDTNLFSVDGLGAIAHGAFTTSGTALSTVSTLTVGTDLTVTGGDIVFGNGQNATTGITATAHNVAGKNLTITAGSPTAGTTNNIAGGHLTIQAGQGKGSAAGGDIIFKTANAAGGSASSLNAYVTALTISDDLSALFGGDVTVSGNTITFGNGAIMENTSSSLLTITEATVTASGHITAGSSITAGTNVVATTSVAAGTTVSATTNLSTARTLQLIPQAGDVAASHGNPTGGAGTGAGTILNGNQVYSLTAIDPTGGATFFTLPSAAVAAANGVQITIKNMSATVAATIEPTGGELIDGGATALSIIAAPNQITLGAMGSVTLAAFVETYWVIPSHPAMAAVGWIVTGHVA